MDLDDLALPPESRRSVARAAAGGVAPERLGERIERLPGLDRLRAAFGTAPAYLAGAAVRDLLADRERESLDILVEGEIGPIAAALGEGAYPSGADELYLPIANHEYRIIRLHEPLSAELDRRDFTINAMAVSLTSEPILIATPTGLEDLARGRLRLVHAGTLGKQPTWAIRAALLCAQLALTLDPTTAAELRRADLGAAGQAAIEHEMRRLAAAPEAMAALRLLEEWNLIDLDGSAELMANRAHDLVAEPPWLGLADRAEAILTAAGVDVPGGPRRWAEGARRAEVLAAAKPDDTTAAIELLAGHTAAEVIAARANGAEWLDRCIEELRMLRMEISADDLRAVGLPNEPAVSRGLRAVIAAKLEGGASDRESELLAALFGSSGRRIRPKDEGPDRMRRIS